MTLGDVETPLAQGMFDPVKDQVTLSEGKVIPDYYRKQLGIEYYEPIDKTKFGLPPSGWCSWYYYYQEISADEFRKNANWMAANLKDYGAKYVQLDDGWQGVGHGNATNRDWNTIDKRFSGGMDALAAHIKSLGMTPGLWLAPHGHSDSTFVKENQDVFLLKSDGTSASDTWEGKFLVDPTTSEAHQYLYDLFARMSSWGYDYFKIDGQPIVTREYRKNKEFMQNPAENTDSLYRATLSTMRSAIGEERYLLGCWIVPLEGIGIMNGSRTSADVVLDWKGFMTSLRSTMDYYFLHNVAWYCDPDVMLLRQPLPMDQARVWATLQGLTGQALMSSDRMMDLPDERVELLRRVYPAVDVRPLDLFPAGKNKRIWDLKVNHLNRQYDIVGLFNYKQDATENLYVGWEELGLNPNQSMHIFDFWNQEYLGSWSNGVSQELPPTSCRVLSLVPDDGSIQLVSTNRHISQGWVDLIELKKSGTTFTGKSSVVANDPYKLQFAFPKGQNFQVKKVTAKSKDGVLAVRKLNHNGWAVVEITSPKTTEISWTIEFESTDIFHMPVEAPVQPFLDNPTLSGATLRWVTKLQTVSGYKVFLDGKELGFTAGCSFQLRDLRPEDAYKAEIQTVWVDGTASEDKAELSFSLNDMLPDELQLSLQEPIGRGSGWRIAGIGRNASGSVITLDGKKYEYGLGIPPNANLEYDLDGNCSRFRAIVGIDDQHGGEGEVEFIVKGDDKELWRSGYVSKSDQDVPVDLDIQGIKRLNLIVKRGEKGGTGDPANWADARIVLNKLGNIEKN